MAASGRHLDMGCQRSLDLVLRDVRKPAAQAWLQNAGEHEKRSMVRLARFVEPAALAGIDKPRARGLAPKVSDVPRSQSMPTSYRPSPMAVNVHAMGDTMYANSLKHLLKPELHDYIDPWLRQALPVDKRGVANLDRLAQPRLIARMGRPADAARPMASRVQRGGLQAAGMNTLTSGLSP